MFEKPDDETHNYRFNGLSFCHLSCLTVLSPWYCIIRLGGGGGGGGDMSCLMFCRC